MTQVVDAMYSMSNQSTLESLQQGFSGIFDTIANTLIVKQILSSFFLLIKCNNKFLIMFFFVIQGVSSPLNSRSKFLDSDAPTNDSGENFIILIKDNIYENSY